METSISPITSGLEGVIHYSVNTPSDVSENSYMLGPRYIVRHKRIEGMAKCSSVWVTLDYRTAAILIRARRHTLNMQSAVGLDVHATPHINIRAIDFEAQKWPGFAANGLSPYALTFGASYVFH